MSIQGIQQWQCNVPGSAGMSVQVFDGDGVAPIDRGPWVVCFVGTPSYWAVQGVDRWYVTSERERATVFWNLQVAEQVVADHLLPGYTLVYA